MLLKPLLLLSLNYLTVCNGNTRYKYGYSCHKYRDHKIQIPYKHDIFLTKPQLIKSEVLIVKDYNWMDRKEEMSFDKQ